MAMIKNDKTTRSGAVDLDEKELGDVSGGPAYLKLGDIEGESTNVVARDGLAQKVKIGGGRLPNGSIRALKLR